jgi:hypothetical protein
LEYAKYNFACGSLWVETWSWQRGEHRLRMLEFEDRVLRRVFGLKREEVTECWRKLCNDELPLCQV